MKQRWKPLILSLALFSALTALSSTAFSYGYVRTMTCGSSSGIPCRPNQIPMPLSWPMNCVSFEISDLGSSQFKDETGDRLPQAAIDAVTNGFAAWSDVTTSSFQYKYLGLFHGTSPSSSHPNAVFWRDNWPADLSDKALGVTSVNYRPSNGGIVNAMMEINTSPKFVVTFPPMIPRTDLQNTVTHEAGHFLGLSHSPIRDATMFGESPLGETTKRTLKQADKEGVSEIYPDVYGNECVQVLSSNLNVTEEDSCSSTGESSKLAWPLLIIGAFWIRRRRRKNS